MGEAEMRAKGASLNLRGPGPLASPWGRHCNLVVASQSIYSRVHYIEVKFTSVYSGPSKWLFY